MTFEKISIAVQNYTPTIKERLPSHLNQPSAGQSLGSRLLHFPLVFPSFLNAGLATD
jgi:hypothetical protein